VREYLTDDRVANQIRLRRETYAGVFLLVEGVSDKTFYERFIEKSTCELVSIPGKPSSKLRVISVLTILEKSDFRGVLAIVDSDFDCIKPSSNNSPNLLRTDSHDLETMLIDSPALEKVVTEFGSQDKIKQFNRNVRLTLLEAGASVGYLLYISECDGLNLKFEGITFSKFMNENTLQIDELQLIQEVKNKSQTWSLNNEELHKRLLQEKARKHDLLQVCCGHHLVEVLSLSLRKTIGSNKADDVTPVCLERSLRLAYEAIYFRDTQLYSDIRAWESHNQPFRVLRTDL
jgi:hypothetical protein